MGVDFLWLGAVFVLFVVVVGRTKSTPSLGIGLEFDNILLSLVIVIVV